MHPNLHSDGSQGSYQNLRLHTLEPVTEWSHRSAAVEVSGQAEVGV